MTSGAKGTKVMAPLKTRHTAAESAKLDASLGAAFDDDRRQWLDTLQPLR
mgnify:CR=1 FL=1